MKLKLVDKHEIVAFAHYVTEVQKLLQIKKEKLQRVKASVELLEINVMFLEITELKYRTDLTKYKSENQFKFKKITVKITPIQGYIIIRYLKEYQSSGDSKYGSYVSHFIKEQSAHIWKELLTN